MSKSSTLPLAALAPRRPTRRYLLLKGIGFIAIHAAAWPDRAAHAAGILGVRVWPSQAYTRVTLELEQRLVVQHQLLESPLRLVIDLQDLQIDNALRQLPSIIPSDDPWIAQLRVGQFQPRIVRLVFDLRQSVRVEIFESLPVGPYQRRWMIDLHPEREPDALQALLNRRFAARSEEPGLEQLIEDLAKRDADRKDGAARTRRPAPSPAIAEGSQAVGTTSGSANPASGMADPAAGPKSPPTGSTTTAGQTTRLASSSVSNLAARIIAIDAGHGGEDPGAIGPSGLKEKDVVLDVARKLAERLAGDQGLRPALIRESDYFVPLGQRVRKARALKADLMLSVHADAFTEPRARGASAFVLAEGAASSASARYLAQKENAADELGGVDLRRRDKDATRILLELSTRTQIRESSDLASLLLGQLGRIGQLHKSKVERAGFAVLRAPDVPSVLVETAFISNPEEEQRLADPGYRDQLADALHLGIKQYLVANATIGAKPR
ncbi:MAG: AMIN domain-containing protein [Betaproteobacteria bacterium]|nr:AMIN domain-containing protein [Betaproteobacteria bacterium]